MSSGIYLFKTIATKPRLFSFFFPIDLYFFSVTSNLTILAVFKLILNRFDSIDRSLTFYRQNHLGIEYTVSYINFIL